MTEGRTDRSDTVRTTVRHASRQPVGQNAIHRDLGRVARRPFRVSVSVDGRPRPFHCTIAGRPHSLTCSLPAWPCCAGRWNRAARWCARIRVYIPGCRPSLGTMHVHCSTVAYSPASPSLGRCRCRCVGVCCCFPSVPPSAGSGSSPRHALSARPTVQRSHLHGVLLPPPTGMFVCARRGEMCDNEEVAPWSPVRVHLLCSLRLRVFSPFRVENGLAHCHSTDTPRTRTGHCMARTMLLKYDHAMTWHVMPFMPITPAPPAPLLGPSPRTTCSGVERMGR